MHVTRAKNVPLLTAMAKSRLTGTKVAHRAGIHRVSLSLILNGRVSPKPETIRAIARALNTTPEKLGFMPSAKGGRQ